MAKNSDNLIKKTCKELGLTYRELGERIGYSGDSLNTLSNKKDEDLSNQLKRTIELFLENLELKKQLQNTEVLKSAIKTLLS